MKRREKGTKDYFKTRMSLSRFAHMLPCFTEEQQKAVEDMGFGSFLTFNFESVPGYILAWLVERFDLYAQKFCISNTNQIDIMLMDKHLALGIPYGDR